MFLAGQLIAPDPPQWIIDDAFNKLENNSPIMNTWGDDYANRIIYHPMGEFQSSNNKVIYLESKCLNWAMENISREVIDIRVFGSTPGRMLTGPHTDMTRKYTLIYLLKGGGPYHRTVFYKEKDNKNITYTGRYSVVDYSKLEQLCQIQLPLNKWTMLNSHVLHSVEHIEEGRIGIQINMDNLPEELKFRNVISITEFDK